MHIVLSKSLTACVLVSAKILAFSATVRVRINEIILRVSMGEVHYNIKTSVTSTDVSLPILSTCLFQLLPNL